ncbi:MAG: hypothetical protein EBR23_00855 [Planctomycetia bacterium]|nr:hypothetical protein [Planctomycetia bacterium]
MRVALAPAQFRLDAAAHLRPQVMPSQSRCDRTTISAARRPLPVSRSPPAPRSMLPSRHSHQAASTSSMPARGAATARASAASSARHTAASLSSQATRHASRNRDTACDTIPSSGANTAAATYSMPSTTAIMPAAFVFQCQAAT